MKDQLACLERVPKEEQFLRYSSFTSYCDAAARPSAPTNPLVRPSRRATRTFRSAGASAKRFEIQNINVAVRGNLNHPGSPQPREFA